MIRTLASAAALLLAAGAAPVAMAHPTDTPAPAAASSTPGFATSDATDPYNVTADELRQFIERYEQLDSEKQDAAEQQKELMAEAKGRGYDTKVMRKVVALRKRKPDDIAEEEAVLEMYKAALGLA